MALKSDLSVDFSKFDVKSVTPKTTALNDHLMKLTANIPKWWEVGAPRYREMREKGETALPGPVLLESAEPFTIPSRDKGREIPCRLLKTTSGAVKHVFMHIHGGGWVLGSEASHDTLLQYLAEQAGLAVVSVGYRLAPEHPFPQPNEDCYDTADWLVDDAEKHFGAPLSFIGGESAGGHLSAVTLYHLLESRPNHSLRGIVLNFGIFNCAEFFPQVYHFNLPLVLDLEITKEFLAAYCPYNTPEQRRSKWISPIYANLNGLKLPPALFTCGTADPLLDDSVFMSTKWLMSGAEAILKIYPGAAHGFVGFPRDSNEETARAVADIIQFISDHS